MLYYLPLEPYKERYTMQLSAANVGWYERNWKKYGVDYQRIAPDNLPEIAPIKTGQVLDAHHRSQWSFIQIMKLMELVKQGKITNSDTILFDDFWTPGIESLFYLLDLENLRPKMYAYCWAQSVDEYDFTFKMRNWMRHYERGIGNKLTGIFVANTLLKQLLQAAGIGVPHDNIHVVGLPFDSEEVMNRMPYWYRNQDRVDSAYLVRRMNEVVFSSRWDEEKDPSFFLALAETFKGIMGVSSPKFRVCTSARALRSNNPLLLKALKSAIEEENSNVILSENLSKEAYYNILCQAKVQFNCADQDWVSFSLLEASVAGCYPIYPNFRSFPETFANQDQFLYRKHDLKSAYAVVHNIIHCDNLWTPEAIKSRQWIHKRFDGTWLRMCRIMEESPMYTSDISHLEKLSLHPYSEAAVDARLC